MTVPNFTAGQVLTAAELDTLRSALGMTIPDFVAGQVLTAAELNELVDVANNAIFYGVATGGTSSSITVRACFLHDAQVHNRQQHCCFDCGTYLMCYMVGGGGCRRWCRRRIRHGRWWRRTSFTNNNLFTSRNTHSYGRRWRCITNRSSRR
jgi:hypothetical protein